MDMSWSLVERYPAISDGERVLVIEKLDYNKLSLSTITAALLRAMTVAVAVPGSTNRLACSAQLPSNVRHVDT